MDDNILLKDEPKNNFYYVKEALFTWLGYLLINNSKIYFDINN